MGSALETRILTCQRDLQLFEYVRQQKAVELDQHYSLLPEEIRERGVFSFATYPPTDSSFLVTQLWDKYLPLCREHQAPCNFRSGWSD